MQLVPKDHPALKTVCEPFDFAAPQMDPHRLVNGLADIMQRKRGLGLAAPQVGITLRVFVMRSGEGWTAVFNPEIVATSGSALADEGCLSLPGVFLPICRPKAIEAVWFDAMGREQHGELIGMSARCFAHEYDHLDGKPLWEQAGPMAMALAMKRAQQARRFH